MTRLIGFYTGQRQLKVRNSCLPPNEVTRSWSLGCAGKSVAVTDQGHGILFSNGNANMVTAVNCLSSLWGSIDYQSGLKGQIVACCQQLNV
jgi:hypothetical protein